MRWFYSSKQTYLSSRWLIFNKTGATATWRYEVKKGVIVTVNLLT